MRTALSRFAFLALALLLIAAATLRAAPGQPSVLWVACIACGDHGTADLLLNIFLFTPFGAALAAIIPCCRIPRALVWGALASTAVEVAQLALPGRNASLGDIVANTLGTGLGAVLFVTAPRWLYPQHASRLSRIAATLAAGICVLTGWLLTPQLPESRYYAQWTPNLAHLQWYRGRVRSATLNEGLRLSSGPLVDSRRVREALLADSGFTLQVKGMAGPAPRGLAPFFAIFDEHRREMLLLGPDRDDLVLRMSTRAAAARLDRPDLRIHHGLRGTRPGDSLAVAVRGQRGVYRIMLNGAERDPFGFTPGVGWAFLVYPDSLSASSKIVLGGLWLAMLFAPAGFWLRGRRDAAVAALAIVVALIGAPLVTPLLRTPAIQWAGALLGVFIGLLLQVAFSRRLSGARAGL